MKTLRNQDGVALITALMFTLICLGMIMALLYYVTAGTRMSAAQKRYRNSLEASYGGTEFVTKTVIPRLFADYSTGRRTLLDDFSGGSDLGLVLGADLQTKMFAPTRDWGGVNRTTDPKDSPDVIFTLKGTTSGGDFKVYSKIIDTIPGVGLLDSSGIDYLEAGIGVAGTSTATRTPRTPNIYTIEVQGEAAVKPEEKAGVSVLYAY